jgi:arabinogalactan oligomer/maltooligosaccharide transport system permease protein
MAFFSGGVGLAVKLVLLAIVNAVALWAAVILAGDEKWVALVALLVSTALIDLVYLLPGTRTLPAKFLLPGTVFLLAWQVIPIAYTVNVAFSNYSTGHVLEKSEAIETIKERSLAETPDSSSYVMTPARDEDGKLVLLLLDENTNEAYVGTREGLEPLEPGTAQVQDGLITAAEGYQVVQGEALLALDRQLQTFTVPTTGDNAIRPEGLEVAIEVAPTLRYDAQRDVFISTENGTVYRDNGEGSYAPVRGEVLEPGWKTYIGFENFTRVVEDPLIRQPFIRVFFWTILFAAITVFVSFAIGLFLAITLQMPFRGQRVYRTVLVIPWAIPAFLMLLVWAGLLNDDFGVVNQLLPAALEKPWLFDSFWAKISCLIVSVWMTFPYFFLVSLGALQSIPGELVEAARVDGGGAWQVFRRITLPLLLVAVAPLLIASFAFNFNNFNSIYLLTGGGPPDEQGSVAGATDILISYTYKIAIESGRGQDYALAATISLFIFLIVATISAVGFWRTASLENVR